MKLALVALAVAQLAVLDQSPSEAGVASRQLIYLGGSAADPVARWVNIDKAGNAAVGSGIPDWWQGVNPPC